MKEFWNMVQLVITAIGGWLGYFLGGCDGLIMALLLFVAADYITGIMCAISDRRLSSEVRNCKCAGCADYRNRFGSKNGSDFFLSQQ